MAEDNVKYLKILDKFYEPLYRLNPTEIGSHLPHLIYAIGMVYSTSRFFNTEKMITLVFVKVCFSTAYTERMIYLNQMNHFNSNEFIYN